MADEDGSVEEPKLGSPGVFTSLLTFVAACFALVTFARGLQSYWEYPYLSLDDPARTVFLRAEYERRVAQVWPSWVPPLVGSLEDCARAFKEIADEAWRSETRLPDGKLDAVEEVTLATSVVAAGWGAPESLEVVRRTRENDLPRYLLPRVRELRRGDTATDHARALVARRWNASVLIAEWSAMGGALLAGFFLWRRRAQRGPAPEMRPVLFGPAQAWVVLSWSFAALALVWRFYAADVPLVGEVGRTVPSLILAVVAFVLVRDTHASEARVPLRSLLAVPSDADGRRRWLLLSVLTLGTCVGVGYALGYSLGRIGVHTSWGESLTEPLIHGSGFVAFVTTLELVVFAPFGEELLFRGVLFGALASKLAPRWAALLSAVAFSAWHGYGISGSMTIAFGGFLLALLYLRTRSIVPGMFVHAALNAIVCLNNLGCRV
jgi:membrane protease YdiL (CAAX protease family)